MFKNEYTVIHKGDDGVTSGYAIRHVDDLPHEATIVTTGTLDHCEECINELVSEWEMEQNNYHSCL